MQKNACKNKKSERGELCAAFFMLRGKNLTVREKMLE